MCEARATATSSRTSGRFIFKCGVAQVACSPFQEKLGWQEPTPEQVDENFGCIGRQKCLIFFSYFFIFVP